MHTLNAHTGGSDSGGCRRSTGKWAEAVQSPQQRKMKMGDVLKQIASGARPPEPCNDAELDALPDVSADEERSYVGEGEEDVEDVRWACVREEVLRGPTSQEWSASPVARIADDLLLEAMAT